MSLNGFALLYVAQGQYELAEPLFERSLAICEKTLGPDHSGVAAILENMAILYRATEREKEAEELEARAARIRSIKR
jgi:tetratricopeptide (TPR) repeat protein